MKSLKDMTARNELHIVLFCICLVLFLWPYWGTALQERIGSMFFYIFLVWAFAVAALYLATRHGHRERTDSPKEGNR